MDRVFIHENWPTRFSRAYDKANSSSNQNGMAKATVARIRYYVKTGR